MAQVEEREAESGRASLAHSSSSRSRCVSCFCRVRPPTPSEHTPTPSQKRPVGSISQTFSDVTPCTSELSALFEQKPARHSLVVAWISQAVKSWKLASTAPVVPCAQNASAQLAPESCLSHGHTSVDKTCSHVPLACTVSRASPHPAPHWHTTAGWGSD